MGTQNLEYLPQERQTRIRDFVERLEWIGGTNIRWVRGGDAIWATLPIEFLQARYLKGGQPPPPTGSVQYYLQAGHYASMAYETPPKIGHVCKISRKCIICGREYGIGIVEKHEFQCNEPKKARCNYMPAKLRFAYNHNFASVVGKSWSALMAKHSCKKLVPTLLERKGQRVILYRQRCEQHTMLEEWTAPWLLKAHHAFRNRHKAGAKKPTCSSCDLPINGEGFTHNKEWFHPQCVGYHLATSANSYGVPCAAQSQPTEDEPELPDKVIELDGKVFCQEHGIEYLKAQPYAKKFKKTAFAHIHDNYDYEDDDDEDDMALDKPKLSELGPNPMSSSPNGWMPTKDKTAEHTSVECAFCFMVIGKAERVEKNGKLYHSDCIPVLEVLA